VTLFLRKSKEGNRELTSTPDPATTTKFLGHGRERLTGLNAKFRDGKSEANGRRGKGVDIMNHDDFRRDGGE
jgi:hypothetical protein